MRYEYVIDIAKISPCSRRKYGAVIVRNDATPVSTGYNARVGNCCSGLCVRDSLNIKHGSNTDAGAEIHAEQAALLSRTPGDGVAIYVAGLGPTGEPLVGFESSPCYSCARMLAFGKINWVYLPVKVNDHIKWQSHHIIDIMNRWEREWDTYADLSADLQN